MEGVSPKVSVSLMNVLTWTSFNIGVGCGFYPKFGFPPKSSLILALLRMDGFDF